jgi:hypothetical protein
MTLFRVHLKQLSAIALLPSQPQASMFAMFILVDWL